MTQHFLLANWSNKMKNEFYFKFLEAFATCFFPTLVCWFIAEVIGPSYTYLGLVIAPLLMVTLHYENKFRAI